MEKKISSIDVAREAGVSRATVSYILNNTEGIKIKPETREKVLEAARKLGYHPDSTARALKTRRSMSIGVVSRRDVSEERFTNVLKGIKDILGRHKYSILLCSDELNSRGYTEYYSHYHEKKIDGVILLSQMESINKKEIEKAADIMEKERIPCVFVDYHINKPMVNCVDINYYHGGYISAGHLIEKGHKKIIYLDPGTCTVQETERLNGVKQACTDDGFDPDNLKILIAGENKGEYWENVEELLRSRRDYTALIASWSHFGFKTLYLAGKIGLRVPEELAVIALAGSGFADLSFPKLSTSDLPLYEIGKKSAEALINSIIEDSMPVNIKLPCSLNIRESG